jgi:hypothetical protein
MFSSKKREAKQNAAEDAQKAILQGFEESLTAVEKLGDPGEKLLSLKKIKNDIDAVIAGTKTDIYSLSQNKWLIPFSISIGGAGAVGVLASVVHIALVPLIALPACLVGSYVGLRRVAKEKERLTQASSEYVGALETKKVQAATLSENLIKAELPGIATSTKFADLLAVIPSLRDACTAAFGKQAAARFCVHGSVFRSQSWCAPDPRDE